MNLMYNIPRISILIILALYIPSCKKDPIVENNTEHDRYIIEMNSEYRLSRVTHIVNNTVGYEKSYEYSEKFVNVQTKYSSLTSSLTYFLNQNGLADSCHDGSSTMQYHYDQNSYLTSYSNIYGTIIYFEYANGNMIDLNMGTYRSYCQYNSQINLIDIDSFNGTYLGKLNKNLLQSRRNEYMMASNGSTTTYQYTLNSSGLVTSRIGITTYNRGPQNKSISEFEYIINK